ncbi:conjugal transfer protein TraB [[Pantoea] beijingensis]|uniref:Conjugal transfer protein TraB n=1 Tax=[Pantoea] beijingensis TaxID=1324864 RepID=A0A443I9F6_9GAMM|nr:MULTISPECIES: TraB/GumN family protein [Erwiniaceae]RWR00719.1 conjugal transfer protein TraB [[Pantoea] beijingensis]
MDALLRKVTAWFRGFSAVNYAYPALDITLPGERKLHLVGSIHMGTRDMMPLPATLQQRIISADALIVEADITASGISPFTQSEPQLPLSDRLSADNRQTLQRLCDELTISSELIDTLPGWQIALMLQAQQAQQLGLRPDYGIDYQLLQMAKQRNLNVIELEGPAQQLELLKTLPANGITLLEDTLLHWHTNARLLQTMISWWLEKPPGQTQMALPTTFSRDLNDIMMNQRNQLWCKALHGLAAGRYVVAVGALHLYGEGNLPDLLNRR